MVTETHELLHFLDESHIDTAEESINQEKKKKKTYEHSRGHHIQDMLAVICLISKLFILHGGCRMILFDTVESGILLLSSL